MVMTGFDLRLVIQILLAAIYAAIYPTQELFGHDERYSMPSLPIRVIVALCLPLGAILATICDRITEAGRK